MSAGMVVVAVAVSTFCALVFAFWPALQASRLSPIEALRFE
jgi:ABC-type antimicrobial peptide transport system permease subunit